MLLHQEVEFADSKVGFLISGEKSNGCFALARAPALGTKRVAMAGCYPATAITQLAYPKADRREHPQTPQNSQSLVLKSLHSFLLVNTASLFQ
jgi:hypothetical protein